MAGTLTLCAGPIGNLADASPRLAEALASSDVVYAEDTRRARILLDHLGVSVPCRSYFAGNEAQRAQELAGDLAEGKDVALLTDAGTPGISDPGLSAVRAALEVDAAVTGVPGPSAVTLALAVSGFPADRFVFEGFLPRSGRVRVERLREVSTETRTTVMFCSPRRLARDLEDLAGAAGEQRRCAVCRELTKLHEEVWRGTLGEAAEHWSAQDVRGEVTVVMQAAPEREPDLDQAEAEARRRIDEGDRPSEAVRAVAEETGASRRAIYERVISKPDR